MSSARRPACTAGSGSKPRRVERRGFTDEKIHLFVATGLEEGEASPEGAEDLELVRVPLDQVPSLIEEIEDGKTLAGLLLLLRR